MALHLVSSNSSPEPDDDTPTLTARQLRIMTILASVYADEAFDDTEALGDDPIVEDSEQFVAVLDLLPPVTWSRDRMWRRGLARAFDDLAADLAAGGDPQPRCTAEEMALHLVLRRARGACAAETEHMVEGIDAHLRDDDWRSPMDSLFQDHDVLLLLDPEFVLHGIDYEFLDPDMWFTPFDAATARDPDRPFRR